MSKHYAEISKKMINDLTITEYIDNEIKLMEERIIERMDRLFDKEVDDLERTVKDLFNEHSDNSSKKTINYIIEALMNS
jgi:hypothetical protein